MMSAPAARNARMWAAKSSSVSLTVAKASFALGARSWTISSMRRAFVAEPAASTLTSGGRSPVGDRAGQAVDTVGEHADRDADPRDFQ